MTDHLHRRVTSLFSPDDFARIEEAVRSAEARTSGEIVPYVVGQSDPYEVAEWRAAAFASLTTFAAVAIPEFFLGSWLPAELMAVGAATLLAGVAGILVTRTVAAVKRLFAGKTTIDRRVGQRALEAFVAEEVFATRDRTGILLFVSILERRVIVLGDSGINAKVPQQDWHDVVQRVLDGISSSKPAEGMVDAIRRCGELLERHGVARKADDRDELADGLRAHDQ